VNRRVAGGVVALTLVAVVAACSAGGGVKSVPALISITTTVPPTSTANFSGVNLGSVGGVTTAMTISLTPGQATITGQVVDDTGAPVGGADVQVERVVNDETAATEVTTDANGDFMVAGLLGGAYRVRAWRPPDLAVVSPQIFFLTATQTYNVALQMQRFTGTQVTASIAPDPPIITEPANLAVQVTTASVDASGVVRGVGAPGHSVQLYGPGSWGIAGSPTAVTDSNGLATWEVTCQNLGTQVLDVLVDNGQSYPLNLPGCAPIPTTTTTSTTTTTVAVARTTTTVRH
jgi:hypothetical protein